MFHIRLLLILLLLILYNCSSSKLVSNQGVLSLDLKSKKLTENKSNTNDIISILGPPSTKSSFDENIWIYIETKKINQSIFKLGKKKYQKNNVLVVKIDNKGILKNKEFFNIEDMNELKFEKKITSSEFSKDSYVYKFLTSLREKINAPTKKRQTRN